MTTQTLTANAVEQALDRHASLAMTEIASLAMTEVASLARTEIASLAMTEVASLARTEIASLTMTEVASLARTEIASLAMTEVASLARTEIASLAMTEVASLARTEIEQRAWALLENLSDPEIPVVSLRELGILRDVRLGASGLEVVITPTYSGCPAMGQIEDDVKAALATGGLHATVVTQLAPAWTTDWMTEAAKDKLRAYGIAPPHACASEKSGASNVVQFAARSIQTEVVNCPQCGSANTTETSHFGSTACKALYRCLDCMEPFDYFKPY